MTADRGKPIYVSLENGDSYAIYPGLQIAEFIGSVLGLEGKFMAAIVNNTLQDLRFVLHESCNLGLVDLNSETGFRIFRRSAVFMLAKACCDLFPERVFITKNSLSNGLYCEFANMKPTEEEVRRIEEYMTVLVKKNLPINKLTIPMNEAEAIMIRQQQFEKYNLLRDRLGSMMDIYELDGYYEYAYDHMVIKTGVVQPFRLFQYNYGMILQVPGPKNKGALKPYQEQKKIAQLFQEAKEWAKMLHTPNLAALNDIILRGGLDEILRVNEALHEKKIAWIADQICINPEVRLVLIAGPSASGKTTFAQRLLTHLKVNGKHPISISLDNYFVDRWNTPVDENDEYDFEALEAINLELFNEHLSGLLQGETVELPRYDFETGSSSLSGSRITLPPGELIIVEGIHSLNDRLTYLIDARQKYRIYVSAITQINMDNTNYTSTTDNRLLRRMVRDVRTRSYSCVNTIKMWPSVRRGEENNIFPFQENADIMFNSSLVYELSVLKPFVEPLLDNITPDQEEYIEAQRLSKFLSFFVSAPADHVPPNSILREFIGDSWFDVI